MDPGNKDPGLGTQIPFCALIKQGLHKLASYPASNIMHLILNIILGGLIIVMAY